VTKTTRQSGFRLLCHTGMLLLAVSIPAAHAGKIKCWTNSDGIRECGNVLPPEYVQQGHDELSDTGIKIKHHERALTKEELAERARIEAEKEAAEQARKEQQRQDHVLLSTFASEDEIVMTRDGKITTIKTEIRLTRASLSKAKERLIGLRKEAADLQRNSKPVTESLQKEIDQTEEQIENYKIFIQSKMDEQNSILEKFDTDLKRYRTLRRPRSAVTPQ